MRLLNPFQRIREVFLKFFFNLQEEVLSTIKAYQPISTDFVKAPIIWLHAEWEDADVSVSARRSGYYRNYRVGETQPPRGHLKDPRVVRCDA